MNPILQNNETESITDQKEQKQQQQYRNFDPPFSIKLLCSYLYFIQGIILSLPSTMPLLYKQLPPYSMLSLFEAAVLPFSFKFIFAPFAQKFAIMSYGKRKTWIIMSQLTASFMLFIGSYFTSQEYQITLGWIFIITICFVTMQDISLDALAIKQMKIPHLVGRTQTIMQTAGFIVGGLIFLKGSSTQFSKSIGFDQPFFSSKHLLQFFSVSILIPTLIIHAKFKQTILQSQINITKQSFCSIIKQCKVFIDNKSRYCRACLLFIFLDQGFNFFSAGYEYELVLRGFQRNIINTINNISLIPVGFIILKVSSKIDMVKWPKFMIAQMITRQLLYSFLLFSFPDSQSTQNQKHLVFQSWFIWIVVLVIQFLDTFKFLLVSILINNFPVLGLSGLFITLLNSCSNFGKLKAVHLRIIGILGWKTSSYIGLVLQFFIILFFQKAYKFVIRAQLFGNNQYLQKVLNEKSQKHIQDMGHQSSKHIELNEDIQNQSGEQFIQ